MQSSGVLGGRGAGVLLHHSERDATGIRVRWAERAWCVLPGHASPTV